MADRRSRRPPDDDLTPSTDEFGRTEPDVLKREARRIEREKRRAAQEELGAQASGKKRRRAKKSRQPAEPESSEQRAAPPPRTPPPMPRHPVQHEQPMEPEKVRPRGQRRKGDAAGSAQPTRAVPPRPRKAARREPPSDIDPRPQGSSGSYNRRRFLGFGAVIAGVLLLWFLIALFQPLAGAGKGGDPITVQIPKGANAKQVASILDDAGVISSGSLFELRLKMAGKSGDILPGTYTLADGMSYGTAIDRLTSTSTGGLVTLTIPEGLSRPQIGELTQQTGLNGDYVAATKEGKQYGFDPATYGAKNTTDLEGFLFPATYELDPDASVNQLAQLQLDAFRKNIKSVDMSYAKKKNLTVYDVVIMASMIEREALIPKQRALVAGVMYNRLKSGTPLGIDATTRFETNNYTKAITQAQLDANTPYNTRKNPGLPPGPIGNPGLAALEAAAHPSKDATLYGYVVKPNTCGELAFATSQAQLDKLIAEYNAAREANGGNAPTKC